MKSFSPRSLIFYIGSICLVVILFTLTTAYGEKNLQAPRHIAGRYTLTTPAPIPCFNAAPVALMVQQSGIFLTGALIPVDAPDRVVQMMLDRPPLSGQWLHDQLSLEGATGREQGCTEHIRIDGQLPQTTLSGTLNFRAASASIPFTGDRIDPSASESSQH